MLGIELLGGKLALALMLLRDASLGLQGKALGVAGTYLAVVWELWELGSGNCCLSPSANAPCRCRQAMPAVPGVLGGSRCLCPG